MHVVVEPEKTAIAIWRENVSGKLLVRAAIPKAGAEVVPTSLSQKSKTDAPFESNR
jgi:hypothetical protein